jgi:hypothetical protein
MPIARLPLLHRGEYAPLKEALSQTFQEVMQERSVNFSLEFHVASENAYLFFIQGFKLDKNTLQLEASRGEAFNAPAQVAANDLFMKATGWTIPTEGVEGFPNYFRKVDTRFQSYYSSADLLIDASVAIGHVDPSAWLEFGPEDLSNQIASSKTFWHFIEDTELLCIPGHNIGSTIEAPTTPKSSI